MTVVGRRVLVLSAAMGAGHMQAAGELGRRLRSSGHEVAVADLLELMAWPAGQGFGAVYPWMVRRAPWLYDLVYKHFFLAPQTRAERASIPVRCSLGGLRELADRFRPDVVVSTYHLAGVAAARLRMDGALRAPTVTLITTFGVHDLWFHPATDLYLCITEQAASLARRRTQAAVEVCEPVVRPQFTPAPLPDAARRSSLAPGGERIALVVAGSLGLGSVASTAREVAALPGWRAVVVCGRNQGLRREIEQTAGATALGWVDDMAPVVGAADVVIDNAAGSTAKEALAVGRPVVTYRPLPGHGRHDASMMQAAGLTDVVDDPRILRAALDRLSDPATAAERIRRGRALFGSDPARAIQDLGAAERAKRAA